MTNQLNSSQIRVQVHAVAVIVIIDLSFASSVHDYMLYWLMFLINAVAKRGCEVGWSAIHCNAP